MIVMAFFVVYWLVSNQLLILISTEYLYAIIPSLLRWFSIYLHKLLRGITSKAPTEVVKAEKSKLAELEGQLTAMTAQLETL